MIRQLFSALVLLAAIFIVASCASGSGRSPVAAPVATLEVNNQTDERLAIYLFKSGTRGKRLGEVEPHNNVDFTLTTQEVMNGDYVAFYAKGAYHRSTSLVVTVWKGAVLTWDIQRRMNFITPRYSTRETVTIRRSTQLLPQRTSGSTTPAGLTTPRSRGATSGSPAPAGP
jgi:hypothetical protein